MSLQDVPEHNTFWLKDGKPIKSLAALGREIKQMTAETFLHHVNDEKNDFANWIKHCVKDEKLANKLHATKDLREVSNHIEQRIQELTMPRTKPKQSRTRFKKYKTPIVMHPEHHENPTMHSYFPKVIKTDKVTHLSLIHELPEIKPVKIEKVIHKRKVHRSKRKTKMRLVHENLLQQLIEETKKMHYPGIVAVSYIALGLVFGVAITILVLAFG